MERVNEVAADQRVIRPAFDGARIAGDRFGELTAIFEYVAKVAVRFCERWAQRKRLRVGGDGVVVSPDFAQHVAEIIERFRIFGAQCNRAAVRGNRFFGVTIVSGVMQSVAKSVAGFGEIRL